MSIWQFQIMHMQFNLYGWLHQVCPPKKDSRKVNILRIISKLLRGTEKKSEAATTIHNTKIFFIQERILHIKGFMQIIYMYWHAKETNLFGQHHLNRPLHVVYVDNPVQICPRHAFHGIVPGKYNKMKSTIWTKGAKEHLLMLGKWQPRFSYKPFTPKLMASEY
jgi:hypothetical protein